MNQKRKVQIAAVIGAALSLAGVLLAQSASDKQLVVNGKPLSAAVVQVGGHYYVDVDSLAQISGGAVSIETNRIVLTMPNANANSSAEAATQPAATALSRGFASAAIDALAEMKEWEGALGAMVTYGLADNGAWSQTCHDRVQTSLRQATVAASTSADQSALQLLNDQFGSLSKYAGGVATERQALSGARSMDPNTLANDPALAKISNCGRFLNSMLVSGVFSDDPSCP